MHSVDVALRRGEPGRRHVSMLDVAKEADRSVLLAFWMLKTCVETEPVRSRKLYFFLMDAHTGEVLLLPNDCPPRIATKLGVVTRATSSSRSSVVEPVLISMASLLDSARYACSGTGIDNEHQVFKMFPRKMVDLVADHKQWDTSEL
ncbi:MAG: hypothetical protein ABEI52_03265 [Halobacteriaceae archaeon]